VNNAHQWVQHSDDNGTTWSAAEFVSIVTETHPEWKWLATGPPGSIELSENHPVKPFRIVVPGDHGLKRGNLANNICHGHTIYSDDGGKTWNLGAIGYGDSHGGTIHGDDKETNLNMYFNEHQLVELKDGRILANSRSMAIPVVNTMDRLQATSSDGGISFPETRIVHELSNSLTGNEGSTVRDKKRNILYYSGTNNYVYRTGLSIFRSVNDGEKWEHVLEIDHFMSGYSSLQIDESKDQLQLLYEQTDVRQLVMDPDRFIYRTISLDYLSKKSSLTKRETGAPAGVDSKGLERIWI
jgi:sialidase-1